MRPKLYLSEHVKARMVERGIEWDEVRRVIKYGKRSSAPGNAVLHWSTKTNVAAIINWQNMIVLTVYHLKNSKYRRLMQELINEKTKEAVRS